MVEQAEGPGGVEGAPVPLPVVAAVAETSAQEGARSLPSLVDRIMKLVETVAAPVGAVTGFLLFFGWTYSGAFYGYFGINQRLLEYSVQDHLLQSAQPLFGTAVILLTVVGVLVGTTFLVGKTAIGDLVTVMVAVASLVVSLRWKKCPDPLLVGIGAAAGLILYPILRPEWLLR